MSRILDNIIEPVLGIVPDLACYVDSREQTS